MDLVTGRKYPVSAGNILEIQMEPYQYVWLEAIKQEE
jgi:hypothetical protein